MNLHEYQGKQLFAQYGLPVSKGIAAATVEEAVAAADQIGGNMFVVKAQVHAGGRGKAGGVKLVKTKEEIKANQLAAFWLRLAPTSPRNCIWVLLLIAPAVASCLWPLPKVV
jgi:succinyl-CoA synthetase beta subunit